MTKSVKTLDIYQKAQAEGLTLIEYLQKTATPELKDIMRRMIEAELRKLKRSI